MIIQLLSVAASRDLGVQHKLFARQLSGSRHVIVIIYFVKD